MELRFDGDQGHAIVQVSRYARPWIEQIHDLPSKVAEAAMRIYIRLDAESARREPAYRMRGDWRRPIDDAWNMVASAVLACRGYYVDVSTDGCDVAYHWIGGSNAEIDVMLPYVTRPAGVRVRHHAYCLRYTAERPYQLAYEAGATWWPAAAGWDEATMIAVCDTIARWIATTAAPESYCRCGPDLGAVAEVCRRVPELADAADLLDRRAAADALETWT